MIIRGAARETRRAARAASGSRLFSIAVRPRAPRAVAVVAVAREAAIEIRVTLEAEQDAGRNRGVGEVGEHAVDTEPVELQIFVHRVALVVRDQALLLVAEGPRVHQQADVVRALDQVARRQELAARLARTGQAGSRRANDVALPRTDAVGVGFDLPQPGVGDEEAEGALEQTRIARGGPVVGPVERRGEIEAAVGIHVVGVDQLDQADRRQIAQLHQIALLERLDEDWRVAAVPAGLCQHLHQPLLERQADRLVVGRVFGLWIDADGAALLLGLTLDERDDLLKRGYLELAVELLRPVGEVLHTAQPLDLGQREVRGEEPAFGHAVDYS